MAHDPQMLKGVLSLLLLSVLREEPGYGYGIVTRLKAAGFEDLAEGTVYPALARLESAGLLQSHLEPSSNGPARKYYRTTPAGVKLQAASGQGLLLGRPYPREPSSPIPSLRTARRGLPKRNRESEKRLLQCTPRT